jgi:hypothetical protein
MSNNTTKIKSPAILHGGEVYRGKNHAQIITYIIKNRIKPYLIPTDENTGFVTTEGDFVNRYEARSIAVEAKQVDPNKTISPFKLYSEDLEDLDIDN